MMAPKSVCVSLALVMLSLLFGGGVVAQTPERVLYIRSDFADKPFGVSDELWLERINAIDAEASAFWAHNTYGVKDGFASSFTDVYTLPEALTAGSPFAAGANIGAISSAMRSAAAGDGWDLSQFDQVVLSFSGLPAFPGGALGTPGTVWMPGSNPFAGGFTHEMGHAFGLGHAHHWEGDGVVYPGEFRGGRDGLFMMGSEGGVILRNGLRAPINLPMRYRLGVVPDALVDSAPRPGVHRIHDFDRSDITNDDAYGRSLAKLFNHDGKQFWISFAPGLAEHWSHFGGEVFANGIVVSDLDNAITHSLDFTPGSQGGTGNQEDFVDSRDGALVVGQSYTFPNSSMRLAPLATGTSADGTKWIDVQITSASDFGDVLKLTLDVDTGMGSVSSIGGGTLQMIGYGVSSHSGHLSPTGWMPIAENGWFVAGSPTANHLDQIAGPIGGQTLGTLAVSSSPVAIGNALDLSSLANVPIGSPVDIDVELEYITPDGEIWSGQVEFVGENLVNNLVLSIDSNSGQATLTNRSLSTIRLRGYSVLSEDSLLPNNGNWNSLSDQGVSGVNEANVSASNLSELIPVEADAVTMAPGQELDLGVIFDTANDQDLVLEFVISTIGEGDYNGDGVVDVADYTVWRDNLGEPRMLPGEAATPGVVTMDDYAVWQANFGSVGRTLALNVGLVEYTSSAFLVVVPEPGSSSMALIAFCMTYFGLVSRRNALGFSRC